MKIETGKEYILSNGDIVSFVNGYDDDVKMCNTGRSYYFEMYFYTEPGWIVGVGKTTRVVSEFHTAETEHPYVMRSNLLRVLYIAMQDANPKSAFYAGLKTLSDQVEAGATTISIKD